METRSALYGTRVIDFSWQYTGPAATKFLGDYGAEVIKIENAARPDDIRLSRPFKDGIPGMNRSACFANINTSKYGITLDLNHHKGIEVAKRLVPLGDIVIESFRPGVMKRWGLDYEELKKTKPDIIMASMSIQGQTGPFSGQSGIGTFLQGAVGITHFTGWPDRDPTGTPIPYLNWIAPWFLLVAIMAALDYRRRTGRGQYIDFSQFEPSLHFLAPALLDYTTNGRIQTRRGNRSDRAAPHQAYRCKGGDRWCAIAVCSDQEWKSFCRVIGNPEWTRDPRFSTILGRKEHEDELDRLLEKWTIDSTAEEVMMIMQSAGVAAGIVQNGEDLVDRDPQLRHRHHFHALDHPELGSHICEVAPFRLSDSPANPRRAPCLGEHTEFICRQFLGMSDEEFVGLMQAGAFG